MALRCYLQRTAASTYGGSTLTAALSQVTAFDRKGTAMGTSGPPGPVSSLRLSPDEMRLLASGERCWLLDVGQPGRLDLGASPRWTLWSPDGTKFIGWSQGKLWSVPSTGGSPRIASTSKHRVQLLFSPFPKQKGVICWRGMHRPGRTTTIGGTPKHKHE